MAVSAANLSNLIDKDKPYVHSNINNFHAIHTQSLLRAKNDTGINKTVAALEKVKNDLQKQTDIFLGGLTPKQFLKEYYFGSGRVGKRNYAFFEATQSFFKETNFYYTLLNNIKYDMQLIIKSINGSEIAKKQEDIVLMSLEKSKKYLFDLIFEKNSISRNGKGKRINFKLKNENEIPAVLFKLIENKNSYTAIEKEIIDYIKKMADKTDLVSIIKKAFESNGFKTYVQARVGKTKWNEGAFDQYYTKLIKELEDSLTGKQIESKAHLSGVMGEQFFVGTIKSLTNSGISEKIDIIGDISETDARDKFENALSLVDKVKTSQNGGNDSWKDLSKQSYSDFTLVNPKNGMSARVQSKYYQGVIEKFEKGKQNINQHINLFEAAAGESITKFIERLQTEGQVFADVNPDAIAYVLANSLWFANAGSINRKGEVTDVDMDNRAIFQEIGGGIGNFLGIVVDKELTPILEFSNMFFLINNEVLLPTWIIIEQLIEVIRQNQFGSKMATFSVNKGETININKITKDFEESIGHSGRYLAGGDKAKVFKEAKRKSFKNSGGVFYDDGGYIDPGLLSVGTSMGKEIIKNTNIQMRNINLNIDYERAIKSAYNLFK